MTMPPVVEADRSTARWVLIVLAPAAGISVVLAAWISPELFSRVSVPDWSTMASDIKLKGALDGAMPEVGEMVLVMTLASTWAPLPMVISGTLALVAMIRPKAVPWPMPCTVAEMVPGVRAEPLMVSAFRSKRGMTAKPPR